MLSLEMLHRGDGNGEGKGRTFPYQTDYGVWERREVHSGVLSRSPRPKTDSSAFQALQ